MLKSNTKPGTVLLWAFLVALTFGSIASASDLGPRYWRRHRPKPPVGVAEPAAIALLGAGLVSLGIYAKKKRGKKQ